MTDLAALFQKWGSDKTVNGYAGLYECLFRKCRHEVTAVLEIGIGTMIPGVQSSMVGFALEGYRPGGSLRAWREFFPNAIIHGIDVQPDTQFDDEPNIVTFLCDSRNPSQVTQMLRHSIHKKFDIIVDDGSHVLVDQLATLRNFFSLLKEDGIYVVEDVGHNGFATQHDRIRDMCGDNAFFAAGPDNNPFVVTKRN